MALHSYPESLMQIRQHAGILMRPEYWQLRPQWLQSNPKHLEKIKKIKERRNEEKIEQEKMTSIATVETYELLDKTGFLREGWWIGRDSPEEVLRLATRRARECLEFSRVVGGDTEDGGRLIVATFISREGLVTMMFEGWSRLPADILYEVDSARAVLIGDRTGDDVKLATEPDKHIFIDTALTMLEIPEFGSKGRTGMGSVGEKLGLLMPFKRDGWKNATRKIEKVRYGNWKVKPLPLWKLCYGLLDSEILVHGAVRQARLLLSTMDLKKKKQEEYSMEEMLLKLQYGRGNRIVNNKKISQLTDDVKRDIIKGLAGEWAGMKKPTSREITEDREQGEEKKHAKMGRKKSKNKGQTPFCYADWKDEEEEDDGWPSPPPYIK